MSGKVLHLDAATHKVVDVLLPWYVNGTLEREERELVQKHLAQCERCRREAEWLRELQAAASVAAAAPGASPAVQQLRSRLMAPRAAPGLKRRLPAHWQRLQPWTRALIAAQLAAIVVLGAVVVAREEPRATYRTLGAADSPAATGASLVVVFDPATTELDLRSVLRSVDARIVGGPTQTNAYLLDVPPEARERAIRTLKTDRRVVLVESLAAGGAR
ncbi:MAG TPA: zf-HC2 domain-containing protein [Casimicrobiaceae bacterium]|nr:zf-HC2 domain-containing protein [Casimicrobiaceae bacterium]